MSLDVLLNDFAVKLLQLEANGASGRKQKNFKHLKNKQFARITAESLQKSLERSIQDLLQIELEMIIASKYQVERSEAKRKQSYSEIQLLRAEAEFFFHLIIGEIFSLVF